MKKLIALLMIVSSMFLVACNGATTDEKTETEDSAENGEVSTEMPVPGEEDVEEMVVEEEEKTEEPVEEAPAKTEPPKEEPKVETPAMEAAVFNISGDEFSFGPANLTAKVGQKVTIKFTNNGKAVHDLQVQGLGKTALIDPGQTGSVEFTPTAAGSYTIICTVPGHMELGMSGTLTVQ